MWNIEKKEDNLEQIKGIVIERFIEEKLIQNKEKKDIWIKQIREWTFSIWKKNVWLYVNNKGETLFSLNWIYKDLWEEKYNEYFKKLWYKEIKDQNWYYHLINIKTWKEIPQESLQYYEIFEILAFIDNKLSIYKDNQDNVKDFKKFMKYWKWVYKQIADILEDAIRENKFISRKIKLTSISPLEYFFYLNTGQVEKQDILKYTKQIFNLKYFQKYYENKWFKLLEDKEFEILLWEWKANHDGERILFEKYKAYKISLKPSVKNIELILEKVLSFVEKLELSNTKNKQDQEKIKHRYEELREYLNKKKKELESKQEAQKYISSLERNITDNLW